MRPGHTQTAGRQSNEDVNISYWLHLKTADTDLFPFALAWNKSSVPCSPWRSFGAMCAWKFKPSCAPPHPPCAVSQPRVGAKSSQSLFSGMSFSARWPGSPSCRWLSDSHWCKEGARQRSEKELTRRGTGRREENLAESNEWENKKKKDESSSAACIFLPLSLPAPSNPPPGSPLILRPLFLTCGLCCLQQHSLSSLWEAHDNNRTTEFLTILCLQTLAAIKSRKDAGDQLMQWPTRGLVTPSLFHPICIPLWGGILPLLPPPRRFHFDLCL